MLFLPKIPHLVEKALQNVCARGGHASHRGWLSIAQGVVMHNSYIPAENIGKTAENIRKHLKSSDVILRTTEHPS